jgi:hypothetical protein
VHYSDQLFRRTGEAVKEGLRWVGRYGATYIEILWSSGADPPTLSRKRSFWRVVMLSENWCIQYINDGGLDDECKCSLVEAHVGSGPCIRRWQVSSQLNSLVYLPHRAATEIKTNSNLPINHLGPKAAHGCAAHSAGAPAVPMHICSEHVLKPQPCAF